ncbi:MAG TPA: SPOR domain-containing protein [Sphingomonas sp.]|jgi:Flp pilus assembly protein TadD|nr:SPOR domain-containing protein [Sphingomonas sp.]
MNAQRFARLAATTLSLTALVVATTGAKAPTPAQVEKLLAKGNTADAVAAAEASVAAQPNASANRAQLGRVYLQAGRFASAEAAFSDVLAIDPTDGASALKLALVKIAQGKADGARSVLETNRDRIGGADYGLAVALSGDINGAVQILEAVTRAPGADAKARQNLALAYALQGKWLNARVMAVQDLAPADADARVIQWMNFVRPASHSDQVASLLGVTPAASDAGQPVALAFARPTAEPVKLAEVSKVAEPAPAPVAVAEAAPEPVAEPAPAPVAVAVAAFTPPPAPAPVVAQPAAAAPTTAQLTTAFATARKADFAPVKEVAQRVSVPTAPFAPKAPIIFAKAKPVAPVIRATSGGRYVVQLGAFGSSAQAEKAWKRSSGRLGVASYTPSTMNFRLNNVNFVRLSVGGFPTRTPAVQVCERVRRASGNCFVRINAGDQIAAWIRPNSTTRFASR